MTRQSSFQLASGALNILCIGAHSDDIEIGCGGAILKLLQSHPGSHIVWVVLSAEGSRRTEAVRSATAFLREARSKRIVTKSFRESFFPCHWKEIKKYFERLRGSTDPDLIFTHYRHDLHQDHKVVCELTWNTYRCHHILEYEIPKYDGDLGQPNVFFPLAESLGERKVKLLMEGFSTQRSKQWFTADTFYALLRLRGIESNTAQRYAEAFYGRKIILG